MANNHRYPPLFLFVGKSASGKTTIANLLWERLAMRQVYSYTTRPERYEGEPGHLFVSDAEFPSSDKRAAYTVYNGYQYCATFEQLEEADIYVVDIPGIEMIMQYQRYVGRDIHIVYFDANPATRIRRMIGRGSSDRQIIERLLVDDNEDWFAQLCHMRQYTDDFYWDVYNLHEVDADATLEAVYSEVTDIINTVYERYMASHT